MGTTYEALETQPDSSRNSTSQKNNSMKAVGKCTRINTQTVNQLQLYCCVSLKTRSLKRVLQGSLLESVLKATV